MTKTPNKLSDILHKASSSGKLYVFLFCLFLSTLFWLLNSLGNNYTSEIACKVNYENQPEGKIVLNELPQKFALKVKGLGFDLLAYKLNLTEPTINIDLGTINNVSRANAKVTTTISSSLYESSISNQLGDKIEIKSMFPDSIQFVMDNRSEKRVKIIPNLDISFEKQFQQFGAVDVKPVLTFVTGPASVLDTLSAVYTTKIKYEALSETVTETVGFDEAYSTLKLSFKPNQVLVYIPVEKFTESEKMVLIEAINVPDSISLKAIPKEVKVRFQLPLSKMANLASARFKIEVDYSNIDDSFNHKLKVNLVQFPDYIQGVTLNPSKVEYILKKQ